MAATKKLLLGALVALFILSAGCTSPTGGATKSVWVGNWGALAGLALMVTVLLLALAFIVANFMGDDKLKAWVKKELGQTAYSAVIIVAVVGLVGVADDWLKLMITSNELTDSGWRAYVNQGVCCDPLTTTCLGVVRPRPCHIELASDYLQMLYETAKANSVAYLMNYHVFAFLANMSVGLYFWVWEVQAGLSTTPFAGLSAVSDYFSLLFDLSVKSMMLARGQQVFLDFLNYPFFGLMLSMGLVLRIFYFTRKLGGLLVAIALSMYIVFPMFYVLCSAILWGFMGGWAGGYTFGPAWSSAPGAFTMPYGTGVPADFGLEEGEFSSSGQKINIDICGSTDVAQGVDDRTESELIRKNFRQNFEKMEGTGWFGLIGGFFGQSAAFATGRAFDIHGPVGTLATLMLFTLVLPFLGLMASLASIKAFSPLIGGDVEISVLSRLI